MQAGADMDAGVESPDGEGQTETPYSLAEDEGHRELVSLLAEHRRTREAASSRPEQLPLTGKAGGVRGADTGGADRASS